MLRRSSMHRRHSLAFLISALAAPLAAAQGAEPFSAADLAQAKTLRDAALSDTTAWALIEGLCTQVGARPAGSANDALAVAWAQRELSALGLRTRTEPVDVTPWQRGDAKATLLAPHPMPLVMVALGNSIGTAPEGLEAELAYYPNLDALKADSSNRAQGKVVFIDQRTERSKDGAGYGKAVLARIAGAVEAARRGAVAVAIRSIGTSSDRMAHTGAMRYESQVRQLPAIAVSVPDANTIERLHLRGVPMRMRLNMRNQNGPKTLSANVLAEVPGTDLANEIVLLGAHLDSWDVGQGALDDAAGVGIVGAAAAVIQRAGLKPRRTIRVVLFANEENGFDGANAYSATHKDEPHQLVSESDFGAAKIWRFASRFNDNALPAAAAMAELLAPLGIAAAGNKGNPGPDAGVLMRQRGWPAVGLTQDGSAYFDVHHTDNDTLDKIDRTTLPQNVAAWATVAWLAAQSRLPFGPIVL